VQLQLLVDLLNWELGFSTILESDQFLSQQTSLKKKRPFVTVLHLDCVNYPYLLENFEFYSILSSRSNLFANYPHHSHFIQDLFRSEFLAVIKIKY